MQDAKRIGVVIAITLLTACGGSDDPRLKANVIDQDSLCEVKEWQLDTTTKQCKTGQKVVYLPNSWGNEQLPVIFAAVNCDLRYSVALTEGAVTCIYYPFKTSQ